MPGLCETLLTAARLLEREAEALRSCHTLRGRWSKDELEARASYEEMRDVAKSLRAAEKYMAVNPLGGPAKAFDAIADQVRCGVGLDDAMRAFGVRWEKTNARSKRHNTERSGAERPTGAPSSPATDTK